MTLILDIVPNEMFHFRHFVRWRMRARKDRKERNKQRSDLLQKMFACWCLFVPLQKARKELGNAVENKYLNVAHNFQVEERESLTSCVIVFFVLHCHNSIDLL